MGRKQQHPGGGEGAAQQHFADAADMNKIMERYHKTGLLQGPGPGRLVGARKPMFIEVSGESFHEMLCKVQEIQGQFSGLPSRVRRRFANNPERLLAFLQDPKNLEEAIELGLIEEAELPEDKKAQLDLVREADKKDREEFEAWKKQRMKPAQDGPELEYVEEPPRREGGKKR